MRENVHKYGFADKLASFKSLDMGVHDFQKDHQVTMQRMREAAREAVEKDGANVLVLGCTIEFGFIGKFRRNWVFRLLMQALHLLNTPNF